MSRFSIYLKLTIFPAAPDKSPRLFSKKQTTGQVHSHYTTQNKVQLRTPEENADSSASYRQISVLTDQQALAQMMKLCNPLAIEQVYKFGRKLGSGAGGTVYQGTHNKTGEKVAVKTIDLLTNEKKVHLLMEIQVMRELTHRNLVTFTDIFLATQ